MSSKQKRVNSVYGGPLFIYPCRLVSASPPPTHIHSNSYFLCLQIVTLTEETLSSVCLGESLSLSELRVRVGKGGDGIGELTSSLRAQGTQVLRESLRPNCKGLCKGPCQVR